MADEQSKLNDRAIEFIDFNIEVFFAVRERLVRRSSTYYVETADDIAAALTGPIVVGLMGQSFMDRM